MFGHMKCNKKELDFRTYCLKSAPEFDFCVLGSLHLWFQWKDMKTNQCKLVQSMWRQLTYHVSLSPPLPFSLISDIHFHNFSLKVFNLCVLSKLMKSCWQNQRSFTWEMFHFCIISFCLILLFVHSRSLLFNTSIVVLASYISLILPTYHMLSIVSPVNCYQIIL